MGQLVWLGRFSPVAAADDDDNDVLYSNNDSNDQAAVPPEAYAAERNRAASAIAWPGEPSSMPIYPVRRIFRRDQMLEEAIER